MTEQILAAHENVTTSDEQPVLDGIATRLSGILGRELSYPSCINTLGPDELRVLRKYYWEKMTHVLGNKILNGKFIDKLPLNIIHLGLIARIFPDAKVIVALRDPRDVCLSCFMQLFHVNETMLQFLDIKNTTQYYAAIMALWLAYRDTLDIQWMESRYEDIVSDFDNSTHRLNTFLGLETQKSLDNFHRQAAARSISTPSYHDVSTPIFQRAVGRWRHYREQLKPAMGELTPFLKTFGYEA